MYSDGGKQFIVGVGSRLYQETNHGSVCEPGSIAIYTRIYPHLDWILNLIGDERCITKAFQPETPWTHLQPVALSILSIALVALVAYLIIVELNKPRNDSPSKCLVRTPKESE